MLYALGMGVVVLVASVAVASLQSGVLNRLRSAGRHLNSIAGVVVMLVGGYLVYYWLTFGQISISLKH